MAEIPPGFRVIRQGTPIPEGFSVVEQQPDRRIAEAEQRLGLLSPERMQEASADDTALGRAFASIPGADVASEFASGAVRGVTEGIDFLTTDAFNAAAELAGSDVRVPRLTNTLQDATGAGRRGFMEPGLARDVVAAAGEVAPAVTGVVAASRGIPGMLDDVARRINPDDTSEFVREGVQRAQEVARRNPVDPTLIAAVRQVQQGDDLSGEARRRLMAADQGPIARRVNPTAETLARQRAEIEAGDVAAARRTIDDTGRIVSDPLARETINQGFDPGVVSQLRTGSVRDRENLRRMVALRRRGMENQRFQALNRPSDVVGGSIVDRLNVITRANRAAGERIGAEAERLRRRGATLDFQDPINDFFSDMASRGVQRGEEGLEFAGSQFEDLPAAERILNVVAKRADRLRNSGSAADAHNLKQFIDEQVAYGRSEGLTGRAEDMVKDLRRGVDGLLDSNFDAYREANDTYSETIRVLEALQKEAGSKIDISGTNNDKALGTLARTIMSNNRGRQPLLNALDDLERVAANQGATFDDDVVLQALFADELDKVFGAVARTSLQGDAEKAARAGVVEGTGGFLREAVGQGFDRLRGRNPENAIDAIDRFLAESP